MSAEVVTPSTFTHIDPDTRNRSVAGTDRSRIAVPVVILPGRRFVMELLATWIDELGAEVVLATNADATSAALRVASNRGVVLVDAGSSERLSERQTLVSRCREQGAEILAVMADDDPLSIATWVEAGATGVLSHHAPLTDVLVHGQDIRRPLRLDHAIDHERLARSLAFVAGKPRGFVTKSLVDGIRFEATDLDWAGGDGAVARGTGEAILLTMVGRRIAVADLEGPGVDTLRGRFGLGRV